MSLTDSIRALIAAAPPDATVTVRWLSELVSEAQDATPSAASGVDLTVPQVAARFGKAPSTVRAWITSGEMPGAYRLHGREWRVPASAVEAMQRAHAAKHETGEQRPARTPDIGSWRDYVKGAA